jgi:hypothetical protein
MLILAKCIYCALKKILMSEFCYKKKDSESQPVHLVDNVYIKAVRVNTEVARLFLCNQQGEKIPIEFKGNIVTQPIYCYLNDLTTESNVPLYNDEWLISWHTDYELWGELLIILNIKTERKHMLSSFNDDD